MDYPISITLRAKMWGSKWWQILYHCPLEVQDYWTIFGKCVWVYVYMSVWVGVCMRALGGDGGSNRTKGRNDDLVIRVLDPQSRDLKFKTAG